MDEFRADLMSHEDEVLSALDRDRPDRYADLGWTEPHRQRLASLYASDPDFLDELAEVHAAEVIARAERSALHSVNKVMDLIVNSGALPIDFMDIASRPLKVGGEKVRVDSSTSTDWRLWADEKADTSTSNHAAELRRCENARRLADLLDSEGVTRLFDLPFDQSAMS